jgi:hypothetical protein
VPTSKHGEDDILRKLLIVTVLAVVLVSVAPGLIRAVAPEVKEP